MSWEVLHSESHAALQTVADDTVDSIGCDPPAGIDFMGRDWDCFRRRHNPADVGRESVFGRTSRTSPHSYGESERDNFVLFMTEIFKESLRVLKPGGYVLSWALPRTSHWTGWALEDAGFEIRDSIHHFFGTGFRKSHDVAKAMQKADGVVPLATVPAANFGPADNPDWNEVNNQLIMPDPEGEAAEWEGFGTGLKPGHEVWWLARKPFKGTVVENVRTWGTGALNLDACQIGVGGDKAEGGCAGSEPLHEGGISERAPADQEKGRAPANLVFTHDERCVLVGTRRIKAVAGTAAGRMAGDQTGVTFGEYAGSERAGERTGFGDADGKETVEDWACVLECPIRRLDDATAKKLHSAGRARKKNPDFAKEGLFGLGGQTGKRYGDAGGASRFFYCAKPSRKEKDLGCVEAGIPPKYRRKDVERKKPFYNNHPTPKSISLMRWLLRLVTPAGGLVLDPFCGSGTTGVACVLEGFSFAGIDKDLPFVDIARARIAYAEKHPDVFRYSA